MHKKIGIWLNIYQRAVDGTLAIYPWIELLEI